MRDKADGRVRPSAACPWWFEKRSISPDGTGRHMVGPGPGRWGWGHHDYRPEGAVFFCACPKSGTFVTPDLDVSVFGCLATRPDGLRIHVETTMPMSFVYCVPRLDGAREQGPRGSPVVYLHRHRTDGSDVPPFLLRFP